MIPISTSLKPRSVPYANYLLIALNILVFALSYRPHQEVIQGQRVLEPLALWAQQFMLTPDRLFIWQFITYAFLHSSKMHIFGNMLFLYLFGNNVNDRLGNVGYLCFYLAGAAFAGMGAMFNPNPVLGASGAVAAVTGAYLILFPNTVITVAYLFFYIFDTLEIRALYFIAFKLIIWDNYLQPMLSPQAIAYGAHLAGYAFGIVCILILLAVRLVDAGHDSLLAILRRRVFPSLTPEPDSPAKSISADTTPVSDQQVSSLREQISTALAAKNLALAAKLYKDLLGLNPGLTLNQQNQLDLANTLMSDSQWDWAAKAYENYLAQYGQNNAEQVQLMLGLLYTRYIYKPDRAEELLRQAQKKLIQPSQIRMCEDLLTELS